MKNNEQLINNIIGQLNGVSRMIKEEKNCLAIITQFKAVRSAINSAMNKYIENNLLQCTSTCGHKEKNMKLRKLILELTKNN